MSGKNGEFSAKAGTWVFGVQVRPWFKEYASEAFGFFGYGEGAIFSNLTAIYISHDHVGVTFSDNMNTVIASCNVEQQLSNGIFPFQVCSISGKFQATSNELSLLMQVDSVKIIDRHLKYFIRPIEQLLPLAEVLSLPPRKVVSPMTFGSILNDSYYDTPSSEISVEILSRKRKQVILLLPEAKRTCIEAKRPSFVSPLKRRVKKQLSLLSKLPQQMKSKKPCGISTKKPCDIYMPSNISHRMARGLSKLAYKAKQKLMSEQNTGVHDIVQQYHNLSVASAGNSTCSSKDSARRGRKEKSKFDIALKEKDLEILKLKLELEKCGLDAMEITLQHSGSRELKILFKEAEIRILKLEGKLESCMMQLRNENTNRSML